MLPCGSKGPQHGPSASGQGLPHGLRRNVHQGDSARARIGDHGQPPIGRYSDVMCPRACRDATQHPFMHGVNDSDVIGPHIRDKSKGGIRAEGDIVRPGIG